MRELSPELKARLRVRAAHNARSMEAEARAIFEAALSTPDDESTDLELPFRSSPRHPPQLGEAAEVPIATDELPALGAPVFLETDRQSDPRQVAAEVADALAGGQEVIVLGRADGVRSMICRTVPMRRGVFVITKEHRSTGLRPHIGAACIFR